MMKCKNPRCSWLQAVLLSSLLLGATYAQAASDDKADLDELQLPMSSEWRLITHDRIHNIRTWARLEDGKRFRSFKVEALLSASMESIARLMLDFDSYPRWYWSVRESRLLRQVSATEYIAYMVHNAPYGMPDRDVILRAMIEPQGKGHPYAVLRVNALPGYMPLQPPLVRMPAEEMQIRFTPQPGNKVLLETEGYVDPGGRVPTWAANFVQRSAPYSIMLGMVRMLEREDYSKGRTTLPFPVYRYEDLP